MLRHLIDHLRIRVAVRDHNKTHKTRVLEVMPSRAELDTIEAFRGLGAQTNFPTRLGQAAQLEALDAPDELVRLIYRVAGTGRITREDLTMLAHEGIRVDLGTTYNETIRKAMRDVENAGRTLRLQQAVRRLAFIAGPGFTTDHLIDEGMLSEGDI